MLHVTKCVAHCVPLYVESIPHCRVLFYPSLLIGWHFELAFVFISLFSRDARCQSRKCLPVVSFVGCNNTLRWLLSQNFHMLVLFTNALLVSIALT